MIVPTKMLNERGFFPVPMFDYRYYRYRPGGYMLIGEILSEISIIFVDDMPICFKVAPDLVVAATMLMIYGCR